MLFFVFACSKFNRVSDSGLGDDSDVPCTPITWYADIDGDGYGRVGSGVEACVAPYANVDNNLDCDDTDAAQHPGASEVPADGEDNDCDGYESCYEDLDGDTYGSESIVDSEDLDCADALESDNDEDCDDGDEDIHPGADEECNGVDDDCDGTVDEDAGEIGTWFADLDGDGYGDPDNALRGCSQPKGSVEDAGDCDDSDPDVNPGGTEVCNGVDDDCDASTAEDGMVMHSDGTDLTAEWTGAPATPTVSTDGAVWICDGSYSVNLSIAADVTLASLSGDASLVVLDGAGEDPVVNVGGGLDVDLEDITLQNGVGNTDLFSDEAGGGILCIGGSDGTDLTLSGVVVQDSEAVLGGGFASYGCDTTFVDVTFSDNAADTLGGAALLLDGTHDWSSVLVEDNYSGKDVGGVHLYGYDTTIEAALDTVYFSGNVAADLGGAAAFTDASVEWSGTSSTDSGMHGNTDSEVDGGLFLANAEVTFDVVDFGEDGDDNSTADVYLNDGDNGWSYEAGDDASFSCDASECGSETEYELGGSDDSTDAVDMAVFDVILADTDATLNRIEIYAQADSSCQLDFYALEASAVTEGPTSWTMVWGNSESADASASPGWNTSDDIGILVSSGTYYAVGVGFQNCSTADVDSTTSPATDGGFGTAIGSAVEDSYATVLSTTASNSLDYDSSVAGPYRIRVGVTEL